MIRSILIGLVAGQRAMTPLAILAAAARRGALRPDAPAAGVLARPAAVASAVAPAAGEMAGDKMRSAPDRIIAPGLIARGATAALAGAALAPRHRRAIGAVLASATAVASSHAGLALRVRAMRRWGQARTGFVEDAIVLAAGWASANAGRRDGRRA